MTPQDAIAFLNSDDYESAGYWLAVKTAIDALEKQIPEPMMKELDISGRPIRVCGNCGDAPGNGEFCGWCGQRIER